MSTLLALAPSQEAVTVKINGSPVKLIVDKSLTMGMSLEMMKGMIESFLNPVATKGLTDLKQKGYDVVPSQVVAGTGTTTVSGTIKNGGKDRPISVDVSTASLRNQDSSVLVAAVIKEANAMGINPGQSATLPKASPTPKPTQPSSTPQEKQDVITIKLDPIKPNSIKGEPSTSAPQSPTTSNQTTAKPAAAPPKAPPQPVALSPEQTRVKGYLDEAVKSGAMDKKSAEILMQKAQDSKSGVTVSMLDSIAQLAKQYGEQKSPEAAQKLVSEALKNGTLSRLSDKFLDTMPTAA